MAKKKDLKAAAASVGTSVFDTIAAGRQTAAPVDDSTEELTKALLNKYTPEIQDTQNSSDTQSVQDARERRGPGRPRSADPSRFVRLNLKLPKELKAYLQAAAYRESGPTHLYSLTEYLTELIRKDMETHK